MFFMMRSRETTDNAALSRLDRSTLFSKLVKNVLTRRKILRYRLVASEQRPALAAEPIVWQLVRLLASYDDPSLKSKIAKLAKTLVEWQPDFRRQLMTKRKALEQAVQGRLLITFYIFSNFSR